MKALKISENVYWVGAIDWNVRNFHGYETEKGTTYNAYLILDEKITLVDTVKDCLQEEMHGYNIGLRVKVMTCGEVTISPGTMYGTLSKMEKDGLISFLREEDKRKIYQITDLGRDVLNLELARIERLYKNSKGERYNGR